MSVAISPPFMFTLEVRPGVVDSIQIKETGSVQTAVFGFCAKHKLNSKSEAFLREQVWGSINRFLEEQEEKKRLEILKESPIGQELKGTRYRCASPPSSFGKYQFLVPKKYIVEPEKNDEELKMKLKRPVPVPRHKKVTERLYSSPKAKKTNDLKTRNIMEFVKTKQYNEEKEATFSPQINPRSLKLAKNFEAYHSSLFKI